MSTRLIRKARSRWLVLPVVLAALAMVGLFASFGSGSDRAAASGHQSIWLSNIFSDWPSIDAGNDDAAIRHADIDMAAEDLANNPLFHVDDCIVGNFTSDCPDDVVFLDGVVDDNDDAAGSVHSVCLIAPIQFRQRIPIGLESDSDVFSVFQIVPTAGSPTVEDDIHWLAIFDYDRDEDPDSIGICISWRSSNVGDQSIRFDLEILEIIDLYAYYDGVKLFGQPLIKEWNSIDKTHLVKVSGELGDPGSADPPSPMYDISGNTGDFAKWGDRDSKFWKQDDVQGTHDVNGMLIKIGNSRGEVLAPRQDFLDYVIGSHYAYEGPIDGVYQKYTLTGNCGSARVENPTTGEVTLLDDPNDSVTIIASDKGTGFSLYPTDNGENADLDDNNLDCRPNDSTGMKIETWAMSQLTSVLDDADDEFVTVYWRASLKSKNKQPILAWAGQRVVLDYDWSILLQDGKTRWCPFDDFGEDDEVFAVYLKQAQGPGAFTLGDLNYDGSENSGDNSFFLPNMFVADAFEDDANDTDRDDMNDDCISSALYESQDPGEVDISLYLCDLDSGNDLKDDSDLDECSPEVDFLIYYMKFESITVGIVPGSRLAHNDGDFKAAAGANPFDQTKDVSSYTANVSADVLVRARVKGWFTNSNPTNRAAAEDSNGNVLPAGRWVMPDDWQKLAGGALALELRPNYDVMISPRGTDKCSDFETCSATPIGASKAVKHWPVAGPFSLIDGPGGDDSRALHVDEVRRETNLPDGKIDDTDAIMPVAPVTFRLGGAGEFKQVNKWGVYKNNPYYVTHVPAEPWISPWNADGPGYQWNTWHADPPNGGIYTFWEPVASSATRFTAFSDNHGEAMVYVNGDKNLTWNECDDDVGPWPAGIVDISAKGHYCELGDLVGVSTVSAHVDYPDKRKHFPILGNSVSIDWEWGGYKIVDVIDQAQAQFKIVKIRELDRDGFCNSGATKIYDTKGTADTSDDVLLGTATSKYPVLGRKIKFQLDVITGGSIVAVSSGGTIGVLGQSAEAPLILDPATKECVAWVKVSNSLLGVANVLVIADNPEGVITFDRVIDFQTSVTLTLNFRWSLITWPGKDNIAVATALGSIIDQVTAVYGWQQQAQKWLAFFPDGASVPGANDLTALNNGSAYWIAIKGPGSVSWTIAVNVD